MIELMFTRNDWDEKPNKKWQFTEKVWSIMGSWWLTNLK